VTRPLTSGQLYQRWLNARGVYEITRSYEHYKLAIRAQFRYLRSIKREPTDDARIQAR
jgi:hypothetical protein